MLWSIFSVKFSSFVFLSLYSSVYHCPFVLFDIYRHLNCSGLGRYLIVVGWNSLGISILYIFMTFWLLLIIILCMAFVADNFIIFWQLAICIYLVILFLKIYNNYYLFYFLPFSLLICEFYSNYYYCYYSLEYSLMTYLLMNYNLYRVYVLV